jgi:hypothetical protein
LTSRAYARDLADPDWLPLFDPSTPVAPGAPALVTPPFPDNPSGHSAPGTTRHFARFSDILREVMNARVWAGIHFRTAHVEGAKLGATVARYERRHYFQPDRSRRAGWRTGSGEAAGPDPSGPGRRSRRSTSAASRGAPTRTSVEKL